MFAPFSKRMLSASSFSLHAFAAADGPAERPPTTMILSIVCKFVQI
jgi:hypothetical protein